MTVCIWDMLKAEIVKNEPSSAGGIDPDTWWLQTISADPLTILADVHWGRNLNQTNTNLQCYSKSKELSWFLYDIHNYD